MRLMIKKVLKKQLAIPLFILIFLIVGTALAIFFGKGYRFGFDTNGPIIAGTGLLVVTSTPNGAQVFVNGHLSTATDNTINLAPGEYEIKIFKDGYFPWQKKIVIKNETVSKADALLYPSAPKLESITNTGVLNPTLDPSRTRLAYLVASQSALKNGVYILDMTARPILTLQSASNQIANNTVNLFSLASVAWSPDSAQILATISNLSATTTYLLDTSTLNQNPQDVTETLASVTTTWYKLKAEKEKAQMDSLTKPLRKVVSEDFKILQWSDDETKILYEASQSAVIPMIITPPLIGTDSTPEVREIQKGQIYVYDIKEDRNYKILDSLPKVNESAPLPIMIHPDSKHLVYVHEGKIDMMEYDTANQTTIYAGPFVDGFVFPWPDATKLVILTNLGNPMITPNLYTISLK
jgi:hypothetical protein